MNQVCCLEAHVIRISYCFLSYLLQVRFVGAWLVHCLAWLRLHSAALHGLLAASSFPVPTSILKPQLVLKNKLEWCDKVLLQLASSLMHEVLLFTCFKLLLKIKFLQSTSLNHLL